MKKRKSSFAALLVAGLFLVGGCLSGCVLLSRHPRHLLLISIDSLQPERLGREWKGRSTTPRIDALARESTRFLRATAPATLTLPSITSLMTGILPSEHQVRFDSGYRFSAELTTLAGSLAAAGFRNGAVVGTSDLGPMSGLNRGFLSFSRPPFGEDREGQRAILARAGEVRASAGQVNQFAMDWLRSNFKEKTFLWLHYRDLHFPYQPVVNSAGRSIRADYQKVLSSLDAAVGRILDAYRDLEILEDTVVILTATHGESLGEHGEETHSNFLYGSTLRIPIFIRVGERFREEFPPGDVADPATLIDIFPTALALLGSSAVPALAGRPLASPAGESIHAEERVAYAETFGPLFRFGWRPLRSLESGEWKLIRTGSHRELYHLPDDPGEQNDLSSKQPEILRELDARMTAISGTETVLWETGTDLSPRQRAELLEGMNLALSTGDPVDQTAAYSRIEKILQLDPGNFWAARQLALRLLRENRGEEGETILRDVVDLYPRLPEAHIWMADFYRESDRPMDAVSESLSALKLSPGRIPFLLFAAAQNSKGGRVEEAVYWMERAVEEEVDSAYLHALAGDFYWEFLDFEKALHHLETAWELQPYEILSPRMIGKCLQHLGRYKEAIDSFRDVEKAFHDMNLAEEIGDTYLLLDQPDEALEEYIRSLSPLISPLDRGIDLANILSSKGRPKLALTVLEALEAQFPRSPEVPYTRGEILLTERDLEAAAANFQHVLAVDPDSGPSLYNLARVALLREDETLALEFLEKAMAGDDGSLLRLLRQDPFFFQTPDGTPLNLYLREILQPGQEG